MTEKEIKCIQARVGVVADGFFGPKSIAAVQAHLRAMMPKKNPWPGTSQEELTRFYGRAGDESKLIPMDVADLGMRYDGKPVRVLRCHRAVAASLLRVLQGIAAGPCRSVLERYAGCYNNRPMRGGSLPSLHARGAAVDLDPDSNGNHTPWPSRATMPLEVMEQFAREGWTCAGAFWLRDPMHFQATAL
jgi:hypothetical protein